MQTYSLKEIAPLLYTFSSVHKYKHRKYFFQIMTYASLCRIVLNGHKSICQRSRRYKKWLFASTLLKTDSEKTKAISVMHSLQNCKEVLAFLGIIVWFVK